MRSFRNPQPTESPPQKRYRKLTIYRAVPVTHGRPCVWPCATHGQQHGRATGWATFLALQHGLAFPMHGRVSFRLLPFALPRLYLTSILPSTPCKTIFVLKTRRFSLKAQISHNLSILESKEANLSLSMWI